MAARVFLCAVALALVSPVAASADHTLVIRLTSVTLFQTPYDKPPKGASAGDRFVARSRLLNRVPQFGKPAGASVGSDQGTLTLVNATTLRSVGVAKLPGGTIRFEGTGRLKSPVTIPIVGGTGDYANARGSLLVSQVGNTTVNTYTVKLPGSA